MKTALSTRTTDVTTLTISLFQLDYDQGDMTSRFERVRAATAEAAARGSSLLLLPELWCSGYDLKNADALAAPLGEGHFAQVAQLARERKLHLCGSMLCREEDGTVRNRAALHGPDGSLLGWYDKLHLFPKLSEDRYLHAGDRLPVFDLPWGRTAMAVCYDLRFPELFRSYALESDPRLVLVPSAWPEPRLKFFTLMTRARACENQCYVVSCNRAGEGEPAFGKSLAADPWGEVVGEAGRGEELLTLELDLDRIDQARASLDLRGDLRRDIFYPPREQDR
jgi:predicted amidohydrolase